MVPDLWQLKARTRELETLAMANIINSLAFHWLRYQQHNFSLNIHMEICKEKKEKKSVVI